MKKRKTKVLIAMSGGVDSSVAAGLLREQGYEVVGCFMRLGSDDSVESPDPESCDPNAKIKPGHQGCCSVNDASDARVVAGMLDIPLYVLNFRKDFDRIINYFVDEYNTGRTPNPCVRCNDWLKFGKLFRYADSIDADYVATGHYARVSHPTDPEKPPQLLRGLDHRKDQSYVLFGTRVDRLSRMLLPVGDLHKHQVRDLAEGWGLPVFNKPDSQEICFVPDNNYARLIERRTPEQVSPGPILDRDGSVIGEHQGHQRYTIGQRRGMSLSLGHPVYVIEKDPRTNTVTVGDQEELLSDGLTADQTNWLIDPPTGNEPIRCSIKIRYNSKPVPGTITVTENGVLEIRFDSPQPAVTPGQAVVCYQDEQVMGGGWIRSGTRSDFSVGA